jgi:hypothetical protein
MQFEKLKHKLAELVNLEGRCIALIASHRPNYSVTKRPWQPCIGPNIQLPKDPGSLA